jgi:hypothetical protein
LAGPNASEEVVWHVWYTAPEVPQELRWLMVAHLERKELVDVLLSRGGQPPHELGLQCGVGALLGQGDDDVLQFYGSLVVQLRDNVEELGLLAADAGHKNCIPAWENHTAGRLAQNGGSRMATLDTSAGGVLSVASILLLGSPMWECYSTR